MRHADPQHGRGGLSCGSLLHRTRVVRWGSALAAGRRKRAGRHSFDTRNRDGEEHEGPHWQPARGGRAGRLHCGETMAATARTRAQPASRQPRRVSLRSCPPRRPASRSQWHRGARRQLRWGQRRLDHAARTEAQRPLSVAPARRHLRSARPRRPHFKFDLNGPDTPPNEIHLAFTANATRNASAEAHSARRVINWWTRSRAVSIGARRAASSAARRGIASS